MKNKSIRRISAHLILDGLGNCFAKGILTVDPDGTILDIEDTKGALTESAEVEFFSGMIVPGFVNAHCHLELSHMHNAFPEGAGFIPFLRQVVTSRTTGQIEAAAATADLLMQKSGIVAVGDISNGTTAFEVKKYSKIYYHTFVEVLGFSPDSAEKAFQWATNCLAQAEALGIKASIVPHAPYSVSAPLFRAVAAEAVRKGSILSLHSQESVEEDELYRTGKGGMSDHLREVLGIDTSFFAPTGESALRSTLEYLPPENNLLMVHNLNTKQTDIDYIRHFRGLDHTWFVLCPGSNLHIQNQLPDIELFRNNRLQICLGTDSLVSNHQLSILEEMKIIQRTFDQVGMDELVSWATINGANALGINDWAGSIEVGKHPGINLLMGLDLIEKKLLPGTRVTKII